MIRLGVVSCLAAALLCGCATRGVLREVNDDLQAVQAEVELLRRAQDDLSRRLVELEGSAQTSREKTDELQAAMAATLSDMERLASQLDAAHDAVARVREELATRFAAGPPPAPGTPGSSPAPQSPGPVPPGAALAPPTAAPATPAPAPSRPAEARPTEARGGSAEAAYAAALTSFRNREYGQAVLDFLGVVTRHPSHALAPSAQYWIGEAYYLQHDYRQALTEFQKVLDWGPATPKAPEALLKVGLCYSYLREGARAQEVWRRVVRDFPDSPSAEQARTLLARRAPPPR